MYRDVERGFGVLDPVIHIFTGGFQLPVLTVLSRLSQYSDYTGSGVSPLPVLVLTGALVYGIWAFAEPAVRPAPEPAETVTGRNTGRYS